MIQAFIKLYKSSQMKLLVWKLFFMVIHPLRRLSGHTTIIISHNHNNSLCRRLPCKGWILNMEGWRIIIACIKKIIQRERVKYLSIYIVLQLNQVPKRRVNQLLPKSKVILKMKVKKERSKNLILNLID